MDRLPFASEVVPTSARSVVSVTSIADRRASGTCLSRARTKLPSVLDDLLIVLIELLDLVTSSGPMRNAIRFIRRSTAGEMLNELRLAPDMLTLAATQQCEQPQRA